MRDEVMERKTIETNSERLDLESTDIKIYSTFLIRLYM